MARAWLPPPLPELDRKDAFSIEAFGKKVIGRTARDILRTRDPSNALLQPNHKPTKGDLGDVMEVYFGIRKNNRPEADFPLAGVELKVLPLKRKGTRLTVKEPTSISMIDYMTLIYERWEQPATVRKKLDRILFVFFVIDPKDLLGSRVKDVLLWEPKEMENAIFKVDWERTWGIVNRGEAHLLSETQAQALAARRKGTGGPREALRPQPRSSVLAPSRAWALKPCFTRQVFDEKVLKQDFEPAFGDLVEEMDSKGLQPAEERIRSSISRFEGQTLASIAAQARVPLRGGKNLAATIIKHALGFERVNARIREFEQLGIDVKTIHLRSRDGFPFEAVSFPAVDLRDLADQTFEGVELEDGTVIHERSELIDQLSRILFVVTYSPNRNDAQETRCLGRTFFWSPTPDQWRTIQSDWEWIRDQVREGRAAYDKPCTERGRKNRMTPGTILHLRPHARVACDEDVDPRGQRVTKQSYWLNKSFVYQLVKENDAIPPGADPKDGTP